MNYQLSSQLQQKFTGLARRIRLAQIYRGLGWLVLSLLAVQVVLFAVDLGIGLEPRGYRVGWLLLVAGGASVLLAGVIWPLCQSLRLAFLAALVEKRHPELEERLLSAVQLSQYSESAHGSPELVAEVIEEASQTSQPLDFLEAYSDRKSRRWLGIAGVSLLVSLVFSFIVPAYGHFQRDLWLAWSLPTSPFVLEVTPGSKVAAKDRPLTIAVQPVAQWTRASLPTASFLVWQEKDGPEKRLSMHPGAEGTFAYTLERLAKEQTYRVEAGGQVSDTFTIKGVEPIRLAQGHPRVQVTPPPYVNSQVHPPLDLQDPGHVLVLQFSVVRLDFLVNRAPQKSFLNLKSEDQTTFSIPVVWQGNQGQVELPAGQTGKFTSSLVLEDEHGLVYQQPLPAWSVWKDEAPVVAEIPWRGKLSAEARRVAPDDRIPLKIGVEDFVGLDRVELEYRINEGGVSTALLLPGEGKLRLFQETTFSLASKVKEGDTFAWRLKVSDNRRLSKGQIWDRDGQVLPESDLAPQVVYEPAPRDGKDRWETLKISRQADPLLEQQILAHREDVRKKIDWLKGQLEQERAQLNKAKMGLHQQPFFSPEQEKQLDQVRQKNKSNQDALRKFGWELGADPFLQLLADRPLALAEGEMVRSDAALAQAGEKKAASEVREQKLGKADYELLQALKGLEQMQQANERLAQDRMDQAKMELLARKQEDLALRAAELAKLDLSKDRGAKAELARLKEEQAKLALELEKLGQKSKIFREALQKARIEQTKQLAREAEKMAQAQRDLFQASQKALMEALQKRLAELAKRQEDLAGRSGELGKQAKVPPGDVVPKFEEARGAATALREGLVEKALLAQEKTMTDLTGLADALGRGMLLGRDSREGALNLARFQERLERELEKLAEEFPRLSPEQLQQRLVGLVQAQKILQDTVGRLEIPANLKEAQATRTLAQELAGQVPMAFRRDGLSALEKMKETQQTLQKLAQQLPANLPAANPQATPLEKLARMQAEQATVLGKEQKELRDEVLKLLGQVAGNEGGKGDSPLHGVAKKQEELQKQTDKLGQDLLKLSQMSGAPEAKNMGAEAAHAAEDSAKAMAQSKEKMKEGKTTEAEKLAEEAALKLEMAGKQATQAANEMQAAMPNKSDAQPEDSTAQSLAQAKNQMNQAQDQLQQGQPQAAQPAMDKSAQALQQAARQAQEQMKKNLRNADGTNPFPNKQGAPGGGLPTNAVLAKELLKYGANSWGELPGELRTRIVQDMRARYGEDYARIIQGYFQGLAVEGQNRPK